MEDYEQITADETFYQPQDAITEAIRVGSLVGAGGFLISAVQNTIQKENVGAMGVLTKFGGTTAIFVGVGTMYGFVSTASSNLREKDDMWSQVHGGAAGGALMGLRTRSMASALGSALLFGTVLGAVQYTGGTLLGGRANEPDMDKSAYKEEMRKRFRRPINEIVNEIGEGRGIYPPGYADRRRERIKAHYGIDVADQPYYKGQSAGNSIS